MENDLFVIGENYTNYPQPPPLPVESKSKGRSTGVLSDKYMDR